MLSIPRRAALASALVCLLAGLLPALAAAPADAEAGNGVPGVPRADAAGVAIGHYFGCVIVGDGSVRCWGDNTNGAMVTGNTEHLGDSPGESTTRIPLPGPARSISAGQYHACAVLESGELRCWGSSGSGQLGQGNEEDIGDGPGEVPVVVDLGAGRTAVAVAAGQSFTCALLDNGDVRCFGDNDDGQLAQGHDSDWGDGLGERTVRVPLSRPAVAIAAADESACAILDTGETRCWGSGSRGQLMQGNFDDVGDDAGESTVAVAAGRRMLAISGGSDHYCAIYDDRTLHCWGESEHGQLGLGRTTAFGDEAGETNVGAVDLPPGRTAMSVTTGSSHSCVVLDTAELRCFGYNSSGQLGQGNTASVGDDPGEYTAGVDIGRPVSAVGAGFSQTCAVTGPELRCWGNGYYLGQGTTIDYGTAPGEVPRLLPPVSLGGQSVARDRDSDGVRDAVDACPTAAGTLADGCPAPKPEALLKGKKVVLDTVVTKTKTSAKCPAKATVKVTTKTTKGKLTVTKPLKTKPVNGGCAVKGTVKLGAKPKKSAKTKVTITGKKLRTKRLVAVRL
ncbi:RCC1 domain-containing protein [Nocardioides sp.]|uniref:RCC1 domain-containing protein n=1 Tax=Nocardioides sp. TaxID=35761 RepID=UPI001A2E1827|nr:RCC1 domain-containing protein [Nocardioides sp.]MBJ7357114.1 hypothetical protein [Nocardioides sp.]